MKKPFIFILTICLIFAFCGCTYIGAKNEFSDSLFVMDTVCTVKAGGNNSEAAVKSAFSKISEIAEKTDFFSDKSEVGVINNLPADTEYTLSEDVFNIIDTALSVSEKSDGAFDITVAPVSSLWKKAQNDKALPDNSLISDALKNVGYKNLILNKDTHTLKKASADTEIDLGGCAKGYAADCAAKILKEHNIDYGIIDLGGNIVTVGKNPKSSDGKWSIGIQRPFSQNGEIFTAVSTEESAVVTSGIYQRYFEKDGKIYHHIVNPKTGYPSESKHKGASIVSSSALLADCLSTACMVLPEDKAEALSAGFDTRLIYSD